MSESHFELFTLTLTSILKSIKKLKDNRMSQFGLRSSHVMLIYQIGNHPEGLTPADLAESSSVDKALISRVISDLLERGFVRTVRPEGRKYKARLCLTESGTEIADYIAATVDDIQHQVSGDIPKADLEVFYRTLSTLQDNFDKLTKADETEESIK